MPGVPPAGVATPLRQLHGVSPTAPRFRLRAARSPGITARNALYAHAYVTFRGAFRAVRVGVPSRCARMRARARSIGLSISLSLLPSLASPIS